MPTIVNVPGYGKIRFGDELSDEEISKVLESEPWKETETEAPEPPLSSPRFDTESFAPIAPGEPIEPFTAEAPPDLPSPPGADLPRLQAIPPEQLQAAEAASQESLVGLKPEMVPTGQQMTEKTGLPIGVTIPASVVGKTAAGIGQFLTTPEGIVKSVLAANPVTGLLGKAVFIYDMAKGLGESSGALTEKLKKANANPENVTPEDWQGIAEDSANTLLMLWGAGKLTSHEVSKISGVPEVRFGNKKTLLSKDLAQELLKGVEKFDASNIKEAATLYGNLRPQHGESTRPVPAQEGGRGVLPPEAGGAQAAQAGQARVLLTPEGRPLNPGGSAAAPSAKPKIVVVEQLFDENNAPFSGGGLATIRPDGTIELHGQRVKSWLESKPEEQRQAMMDSLIAEESNHAKLREVSTPEERAGFWKDMSGLERTAHFRRYTGEWSPEALERKRGHKFTDEQLGFEAMNSFQMRLARMDLREVSEAALKEKWTVKSLDTFANVLFRMRQALGTEASGRQVALLDRVIKNVEFAKETLASSAGPRSYDKDADPDAMAREIGGVKFDTLADFKVPGFKPKWQFTLTDKGMETTFYTDAGVSLAEVARKTGIKKLQFKEQIADYNEAEKIYDERASNPSVEGVKALEPESGRELTATESLMNRLEPQRQPLSYEKEGRRPVFYSRITRTVEQSQQRKATGAQWQATIRNSKLGANADEMSLVGVQDLEPGKVYTKQEVLDYLKANEVVVKDVTLLENPAAQEAQKQIDLIDKRIRGSTNPDTLYKERDKWVNKLEAAKASGGEPIRFFTRQLPGAKEGSSREVFLEVPPQYTKFDEVEGSVLTRFPTWRDGHLQYSFIVNPLVRLLLNERITADGKRMLFLDEVQPPQKGEFEKMPALFQKNWREIGFKWVFRFAVENEFDSVGWTRGDHQVARYDLSKQIDAVVAIKRPEGDFNLGVKKPGESGFTTLASAVKPEALEAHVGKDLASKIIQDSESRSHLEYSGVDLRVGGAGLKKLYDVDFRNVVNNLPAVKKAGQKVGTAELGRYAGDETWTPRDVSDEIGVRDTWVLENDNGALLGTHDHYTRSRENMRLYDGETARAEAAARSSMPGEKIHALTITPDIRESVMGGQPLSYNKLSGKTAKGQEELFLPPLTKGERVERNVPVEIPEEAKRLKITPDEIDWSQQGKRGSYVPITEAQAKDVAGLSKLLTKDARIEGSTLPVSSSRRLTVLQDKRNGQVHLVSTYPHGRSGTMLVNPSKSGVSRPNVPMGELLDRYQPLFSVLRDSPVKKFHQQFDSLSDYMDRFGDEAAARAAASVETPAKGAVEFETGKQGETIARSVKAEDFIPPEESLADELKSFHDIYEGEIPATEKAFIQQAAKAENSRDAMSAIARIANDFQDRNPQASQQASFDAAISQVYEALKQSSNRSEFVKAAMGQSAGAIHTRGQEVQPAPPAPSIGTGVAQAGRQPGAQAPAVNVPQGTPAPRSYDKNTPDVSIAERAILEGAGAFARVYSGWLADNIREHGGEAGRRAADMAAVTIDRSKQLYRDQTPLLDLAKVAAGGSVKKLGQQVPSPSLIRATKWLSTRKEVTPDAAVVNVVAAVEGGKVPDYVLPVIEPARPANLASGQLLEPVTPGFEAWGGFQRNITALGMDALATGEGPLWTHWREGLLKANPPSAFPAINAYFRDMRKLLNEPVFDSAKYDRVNQDFSRKVPNVITHVRTPFGWQEVVHSDLFNYLENTAQRAAHIRAFREQFPATPGGRAKFAALDRDVRNSLPRHMTGDWDALIKTLQGHPTDSYSRTGIWAPGKPIPELARLFNQTAVNLRARLALSAQMVTQASETVIGATPANLGYPTYLRAIMRLPEFWDATEQSGQTNAQIYNWAYDANAPIRSGFRMAGSTISKGFAESFLNELQGRLAAGSARIATERIVSKTASKGELRRYGETFRLMGFPEAQVKSMLAGNAELLGQFERRAPAWLTTENRHLAEGSRLGAHRLFNSSFRFQSYPMMKLNQLRRAYKNVVDAPPERKARAIQTLARNVFFTGAQGAAYTLMASYFFGSKEGLSIRLQEAKDEPLDFLIESTLAAMGGPLYFLWQGARYNGLINVGEQATRLFFPYETGRQLLDALNGDGQYRDLNTPDRIGKFILQSTPGLRLGKSALSVFGLSQENPALEQSIKGFYRWKMDTQGGSIYKENLKDDKRKQFRIQMKRADSALKRGDWKAFERAIVAATVEAEKIPLQASAPQRIAESLRGKKLLQGLSEEELTSLRNRIGDAAVNRLEYYDAELESVADVYGK